MILSYPNDKGLCYATFEHVVKGLEEAGHEVRIADLYKDGFNPVLVFNEERRRRDMQFDPDTEVYRNNILWADRLIFVFPIWWSGMPAMMKGFVDRVFATGFSYDFEGLFAHGHLENKDAWIVNTNDTPKSYWLLFGRDYGRVLKKYVLPTVGIKKVKHYSISYVKHSTPEKRAEWLQRMYEEAKRS